jgi:hypothetical protein
MGVKLAALLAGAVLGGAALAACSAVGARQAEEPAYSVAAELGDVQVRQYGPRVAAETVLDGNEEDARSIGFRHLADYFSGANRSGAKIALTAPEAQDAAGPAAPVAQAGETFGRWRIRFFMPRGDTLATLPQPNDASVVLVAVPPETLAVLRFSGTASAEAVAARTADLVAALEGTAWFYDPPWTLPPLRRNEVAIPVSPK